MIKVTTTADRFDIAARIKIAYEYYENDISIQKLAEKYEVSSAAISSWIKKYLTVEELEELTKTKPYFTFHNNDKPNFKTIIESENEYIRLDTNSVQHINRKYRKFYSETLGVSDGVGLNEEEARKELDKLIRFIKTDEFKTKYHRDYNIVDLYLTTNLRIKDLIYDYQDYMTQEEKLIIFNFIKFQLQLVDNRTIISYKNANKDKLYIRFTKPVKKQMEDLINSKFLYANKIMATPLDIENAYEVLLDLNEKYGVKYDDVSLHIIIREYVNGNIDSFYELAEEYKEELDKHSHVAVRCLPVLTKREKNK